MPVKIKVAILVAMAQPDEPQEQNQPGHNHIPRYHLELGGVTTGTQDPTAPDAVQQHITRFKKWLQGPNPNLTIPINLDIIRSIDLNNIIHCAQCCCQFLHDQRGYQLINHERESCVAFGEELTTHCHVDATSGHNGVVKTNRLEQINQRWHSIRPYATSGTYQFYGQAPAVLGQHTNTDAQLIQQQGLTVRLEAIAVIQLNRQEELRDCYFTYADAVLLEAYRCATGKDSLRGTFMCPTEQEMKKNKGQDEEEIKVEDLCTGVSDVQIK